MLGAPPSFPLSDTSSRGRIRHQRFPFDTSFNRDRDVREPRRAQATKIDDFLRSHYEDISEEEWAPDKGACPICCQDWDELATSVPPVRRLRLRGCTGHFICEPCAKKDIQVRPHRTSELSPREG